MQKIDALALTLMEAHPSIAKDFRWWHELVTATLTLWDGARTDGESGEEKPR